jgi:DnaK suppressor protein
MPKTDKERQGWLRELLLEEKRRLWSEVRAELFEQLGEELHTQYDLPRDIGDQGILDLLDDTGLAIVDIRRQQLTQLEEALSKLEAGRYGRCEDCGKKIDDARLRVAPYAACCVPCQAQREGPAATGRTL